MGLHLAGDTPTLYHVTHESHLTTFALMWLSVALVDTVWLEVEP